MQITVNVSAVCLFRHFPKGFVQSNSSSNVNSTRKYFVTRPSQKSNKPNEKVQGKSSYPTGYLNHAEVSCCIGSIKYASNFFSPMQSRSACEKSILGRILLHLTTPSAVKASYFQWFFVPQSTSSYDSWMNDVLRDLDGTYERNVSSWLLFKVSNIF